MHRPPLMILASENNSGHLREIGHGLRDSDPPVNILAIGGGEFEGVGVFAFTYDNDDDPATVAAVESVLDSAGVTRVDYDGVTVELENKPGRLGDLAEALENATINITSMLVVGGHGSSAIVLVGVPDNSEDDARAALEGAEGIFVFPKLEE
jgi:hypothetical protein